MAKVIPINFKNGSKILIDAIGESSTYPANFKLTIAWTDNPFRDHTLESLLARSMRFLLAMEELGISPELCRQGIPLYEALVVHATTAQMKNASADMAIRLVAALNEFNNPSTPA